MTTRKEPVLFGCTLLSYISFTQTWARVMDEMDERQLVTPRVNINQSILSFKFHIRCFCRWEHALLRYDVKVSDLFDLLYVLFSVFTVISLIKGSRNHLLVVFVEILFLPLTFRWSLSTLSGSLKKIPFDFIYWLFGNLTLCLFLYEF